MSTINNLQPVINVATVSMAAAPTNFVHEILAFVIPLVLTFVQINYPNENLFQTHPVTTNIVLYSLLAYCLAFGVGHIFLAPWFHMSMLLFGSVSLGALLLLLFSIPNHYNSSWLPMLCILFLSILLAMQLLAMLLLALWRLNQRKRLVLPLTVMDIPSEQVRLPNDIWKRIRRSWPLIWNKFEI